MGERGRKSADSLAIVPTMVEVVSRPDAPYDLSDEQSLEWWAIVNRMPADWFPRETHAMLAQLCRHIVAARRVAELITQCEKREKFLAGDYDALLKMQERESRAIASLMTRLRLTQQSTVRHEQARKPTLIERPWEG